MGFFEDSKVEDIVQSTISRVDKLEEAEQRKMLRVFRRVRQELQDRLLAIPEGTFSEQQLRVTLVQVDAAIEAIKRDLKNGMIDASEILASRGIDDLISEIERFSDRFEGAIQPLNINAAVIAADSKNFLLEKHSSSLDAYGAGLRAQITTQISQSMIGRETSERTVGRLVSDVGRFFQGEEWKLNRIVRTELHNIYNFSKLRGMTDIKEQSVPDLKKSLMHPIDTRTGEDSKKLAAENPVVDIDKPFRFKFKSQERVFMFPPDRPNDRSILVPFREAWDKRAAEFSSGS